MNKILKVANYEYTRHVMKPSFWIGIIAIPVGFLLIFGLSMFFSITSADTRPVGVVDEAKIIKAIPVFVKGNFFDDPEPEFKGFSDEVAAKSALDSGEIQSYLLVPETYTNTYKVDYYFDKPITPKIQRGISNLLREGLLSGETIPNLAAIERGTQFTFQSLDGSQTSSAYDWLKFVVPLVIGMLFFITVMMTGSYLLQAIVEEKENRTMEIMLTSSSPNELIGGKIIGDMGIGLTQMLLWVFAAVVIGFIFRDKLGFLQHFKFDLPYILITLLYMVLGFIFISALMGMLGATVTTQQESQQFTGLIVLPMMLPYYLMNTFLTDSNGLIPRILTFFPMSAATAVPLRLGFGPVPAWEIGLSLLTLFLFGVFTIWLAGKAFRLGMLRYEQKVPLKQLFAKEGSHE